MSEKQYRMVQEGEILQAGDEYDTFLYGWMPIVNSIGHTAKGSHMFRRQITAQAPQQEVGKGRDPYRAHRERLVALGVEKPFEPLSHAIQVQHWDDI